MRKSSLIIPTIFAFVLTGCTPKYIDYIDKGKEALLKKNYQEAVTDFKKAVNEKSDKEGQKLLDEASTKLKVQNLLGKGIIAFKNDKDYEEAIKIFKEIDKNYKDNPKLTDFVGSANNYLGDIQKLLMNMARSALQQQYYGQVIPYLSDVIEINNKNKETYTLLQYTENMKNGITQLDNEQYDTALTLFTSALKLKPNDKVAKKLKQEALNDKQQEIADSTDDSQATDGSVNQGSTQNNNGNADSSSNQGGTPNNSNAVPNQQNDSKAQFVNTITNLVNYFNQNINPARAQDGSISADYQIDVINKLYGQFSNVYIPNPKYTPIVASWMELLDNARVLLLHIKERKSGDWSVENYQTFNAYNDSIQKAYDSLKLMD